MNADMVGMPDKDFTVEFWAKTPAYNNEAPVHNPIADLFTYATHIPEAASICESKVARLLRFPTLLCAQQ